MRIRGWATVAAVALPGLVLAAVGAAHPPYLDSTTAADWWRLHVLLLPLFPLLAVALVVLLRGEHGPVAWLARLAAYGYAVFYTGLDTLAGIAAGLALETQDGPSRATLDLAGLGAALGGVGVWCFLAATVLTGVGLVRTHGRRALPGAALLAAAAVPFLDVNVHVFWPRGGAVMLAVAAGCALLEAARRR